MRLLRKLPSPVRLELYKLSIRFDKASAEAFSEAYTGLPFVVSGSLEFPTDRMWKIMNKGYNTKELIESLNILNDLGLTITGGFILGWNCLTENDLTELERFFDKLPVFKKFLLFMFNLHIYPGSMISDKYEVGHKIYNKAFYFGYTPKISPEQEALNNRAFKIVEAGTKGKGIIVNHIQDNTKGS